MTRADTAPICVYCDAPITGSNGAGAVRVSAGPAHGDCHARAQIKIQRRIDAAIAAGTHGTTIQRVCQICGEWVDAIFHRTLDGKSCCRKCAEAMGVKLPDAGGAR